MALISKLTSLADAIRAKAGISGSMTLTEMASAVAAIETGGGLTDEDLYIMGELNEVPSSVYGASVLRQWAFRETHIISGYFPNCTTIEADAFYYCSYLESAIFPVCESIFTYAFAWCSNLSFASFALAPHIASYMFAYCINLRQVSFPEATIVGQCAFSGCNALSFISLPKVAYISVSAFYACKNLISLYLSGSSVVSLAASSAFAGTPMTRTDNPGTIYVPSSLYSSYLLDTRWSFFSSHIVSYTP